MADQSPFVVPMRVHALLVNDAVRQRVGFQRWSLDFAHWAEFQSPEPEPFSVVDLDFGRDSGQNGIYLHWNLPSAFSQNSTQPGANTQFPLAPNRYLVMRQVMKANAPSQPIYASWIVESDFTDPVQGTSPAIQPNGATPQPTKMGRKLVLNTTPYRNTATGQPTLTVVGPGITGFANFQPYNENVFSFHDPLDATVSDGDTVSYLVMGWCTAASGDLLAMGPNTWGQGTPFLDYLNELGWGVNEVGDVPLPYTATTSVYEGLVYGIPWSVAGNPLPIANWPLGEKRPTIAVGQTAVDALSGLVRQAMAAAGLHLEPLFVEAFQYGMLDELLSPGGVAALQRRIQAAWFQQKQGGYRWSMGAMPTSDPSETPPPLTPAQVAQAMASLQSLNTTQANYDAALRQLASQQVALYEMYWKQGFAALNGYPQASANYYAQQLSVNGQGIMTALTETMQQVASLQAQLPTGASPAALAASVDAYLAARNLVIPPGYQLRQYSLQPFCTPNDPTLLIGGLGGDPPTDPTQLLIGRFPSELVTAAQVGATPYTVPNPGGTTGISLSNLPAVTGAIVSEFILLNPALGGATQSHTYTGTLPSLYTPHWAQPWNPLYMEWEVLYFPIDYQTGGAENWDFDGRKFSWKGTGNSGNAIPFNGRIYLSPHGGDNFRWRLEEFLGHLPGMSEERVRALMGEAAEWDYLSQIMDGFGMEFLCRDSAVSALPTSTQAVYQGMTQRQLMGSVPKHPLLPGLPAATAADTHFQVMRSGQMVLNRLNVIDRFGQVVSVVTPVTAQQLHIARGNSMEPAAPLAQHEAYRYIDLQPRLLQPARLDFDLLNPDGQPNWSEPETNPVGGWLISNHVDISLAVYAPSGMALGALKPLMGTEGVWRVLWVPAPVAAAPTLQQVQQNYPLLGNVLTPLLGLTRDAFMDFLELVDERIWGIMPPQDGLANGLSVLSGRPLAVVRARLQFVLGELPMTDPSWYNTLPDAPNPVLQVPLRISLGDLQDFQDGLVGYYLGSDYSHLNVLKLPDNLSTGDAGGYMQVPGSDSLRQALGGAAQQVTMIVDPRGRVNARSGLLPASQLQVPNAFVEPAMRNLQLYFRVGPLLSRLLTVQGGPTTLELNPPQLSTGTWSWVQGFLYDNASAMGLTKIDQSARFENAQLVLRNGMLVLTDAFTDEGANT